MLRRQALSLSAFLLASPLIAQVVPATGQSAPPATGAGRPAASNDDLTRMRSLLQQMEMGLAYLPSGYSAVKHQFELEIGMWRILLDRMERGG